AVRGLHGRARLPVLVPRLCARHRRQRAYVGTRRGAVRAGDLALRVQAGDDLPRSRLHRADRDRSCAAALGAMTACPGRAAAVARTWRGPGSLVALVGQQGQRVKLDPLFVQLFGLIGTGLAVDRAVLDLAVVHLARLFGKFLADIVGVLHDVVAQLLQLLAKLALLRR